MSRPAVFVTWVTAQRRQNRASVGAGASNPNRIAPERCGSSRRYAPDCVASSVLVGTGRSYPERGGCRVSVDLLRRVRAADPGPAKRNHIETTARLRYRFSTLSVWRPDSACAWTTALRTRSSRAAWIG